MDMRAVSDDKVTRQFNYHVHYRARGLWRTNITQIGGTKYIIIYDII